MSTSQVTGQLQQAKVHAARAQAMLTEAATELARANALIVESTRGSADQGPAAAAALSRRRLAETAAGVAGLTTAIDQTIGRLLGSAGPGKR